MTDISVTIIKTRIQRNNSFHVMRENISIEFYTKKINVTVRTKIKNILQSRNWMPDRKEY